MTRFYRGTGIGGQRRSRHASQNGRPGRKKISRGGTRHRHGLSLLEVILAIAILGISMAAISQLFFLGYRSATQATLRNEANILCDTKMAELVAGVLEPQSVGQATIADAPGWGYSIQINDGPQPDLMVATVTVQTVDPDQVPVSMSITRLMVNPDTGEEP